MNPADIISCLTLGVGVYFYMRVRRLDKQLKAMEAEDEAQGLEFDDHNSQILRAHISATQTRGMLTRIRTAAEGLQGVPDGEKAFLLALISTAETVAVVPAPVV